MQSVKGPYNIFAGDNYHPSRQQRFAGDARHRILGQRRVQHGIRDLVGDFVGMTFSDRLGREQDSAVIILITQCATP